MRDASNDVVISTPVTSRVLSKQMRFSFGSLLGGWPLLALSVVGCWVLFLNSVRGEWQINPQSNYGYVVPLLGLTLLWRRWPDRPVPSQPSTRRAVSLLAAALFLLDFPIRMMLEANPEWRLLYWINGAQVLTLTLCAVFFLGGWPWVSHFSPAIFFMLLAVPWPMGLEQAVVQGLMRSVASLTVEVVGWLGIPAVQHGNVVEVGTGLVGIDEACSGVRSLQSALMLSLFLGELHRFSVIRRLGLVCASVIFVLLANLCRTTFLVYMAANRGLQRMEAWHDAAGLVVMFVVLPGLIVLAHLLKPKIHPVTLGPCTETFHADSIPRWAGATAIVWLLLSQVATEAWYRTHESRLLVNPRWSVAWPTANPRFQKSRLPENSLAILRCSQTQAGSWQDDAGNHWSAFLLRWEPGKNSAQLAKGHQPDICFPASGALKVDDFGLMSLNCGGVYLDFRHQVFERHGEWLHVFYCSWADRRAPNERGGVEDGSRSSRLEAVREGRRHLGQQVLEVVITGPDSRAAAESVFQGQLPSLIRVD